MSDPNDSGQFDDPFAQFFVAAEQSPAYWTALARIEFTEKMLARMNELNLKRSALAERLQVKPSFVTRLLSGKNNFELSTMTRIAHALDCDFRCHLQPKGTETIWFNVLNKEPECAPACNDWNSANYHSVRHHSKKSPTDETLRTAA